MLLQYNKVTSYISSGIVAESVIGQSQRGHKIGAFHKLHPHEGRGGVHNTLRCDEGNQSTLTHLIECLEKEVIVYRLC